MLKGQLKSRKDIRFKKKVYITLFVDPKFAVIFIYNIVNSSQKNFLRPLIQNLKIRHFVSFDFRLFVIWETGGVAVTSLSSTMESRSWSSFALSFFFLVLLLVEIEQYAYEPLFEHESGSDEGESDEENHLRKTEWCQCNLSPEESTIVVLSWMRCTINCKVDSFNQLYVKTREL